MDKEEQKQTTDNEVEQTKEDSETHAKKERRLVVPGEVIVSGDDYLPGDFTTKQGKDIIANRYGLAEDSGRIVKIIPVSGTFEPRRGNTVIGVVMDINFSGWNINIGGPYSAFLPLSECPRFIDRNNLAEFANIGDVIVAKTYGIKKGGIDLTLKSRGLGKLEGGRIIKINSHKVPRVIGKEGSMINLVKNTTETEITVGQNGSIWIKGSEEGENKAEEAIKLIEIEASNDGLTEKIEKFLEVGK